ncbi:dTDP-4-dehydrorhamnose reductase [Micromonospora sp. NPDC002296]|uniref:dTDP-4-dehydrorhamnose reductase n=1 Tax=Micromonospora sp. NPDC002296 TaxID=3154271 RepID=UPI003325B09C
MIRWLVTGAGGGLGRDLVARLRADPAARVTAAPRVALDICDPDAVAAAVVGHDVVVNAAAWTDVDAAESAPERAAAVNGDAVAGLARACAATGARLLHVSTDYVFSGEGAAPRREDEPPAPVNAYGRSKLVGERAVARFLPEHGYVVRTAWLYTGRGDGFVGTMLRQAAARDTLSVVDDQRGQPTWSAALADQLAALGAAARAGAAPAGTYHGTAAGQTTWYGLARAVFAEAGLDPDRVRPTTTDQFPRPARRPSFSVLGHDRWRSAGLPAQPSWRDQLATALLQPGLAALARAARQGPHAGRRP